MTGEIASAAVEFELLGHDCPLGHYPSLVVPVGRLAGGLIAVYTGQSGSQFHPVTSDSQFALHDSTTADMLKHFDPLAHGLFAFKETEIVVYETGKEREFYSRLLRSSAAGSIELFYRLSLALEAGEPSLIRPLFSKCTKQMKRYARDFTEAWMNSLSRLSTQVEEIRTETLPVLRPKPSLATATAAATIAADASNVLLLKPDLRLSIEEAADVVSALRQVVQRELFSRLPGYAYHTAIQTSLGEKLRLHELSIGGGDAYEQGDRYHYKQDRDYHYAYEEGRRDKLDDGFLHTVEEFYRPHYEQDDRLRYAYEQGYREGYRSYIANSLDVARHSGLSLSLLEFNQIILSRDTAVHFLEVAGQRKLLSFARQMLRSQVYEMHFHRPVVRVNRRQVYTYAEVISLLGL